jgi:hypothetical protein
VLYQRDSSERIVYAVIGLARLITSGGLASEMDFCDW